MIVEDAEFPGVQNLCPEDLNTVLFWSLETESGIYVMVGGKLKINPIPSDFFVHCSQKIIRFVDYFCWTWTC